MTLAEILSTLTSVKVVASIMEENGTLISEIKASTYESLDAEIKAREVKTWSITTNSLINIYLKVVDIGG